MSDYETFKLLNDLDKNSSYASVPEEVGVWIFISAILAIVGGILTYFLFVKNKTAPKGNFAIWLKKFLKFEILWIEPILKVIYYISTIFVILSSFSYLSMGGAGILAFFLSLIIGPTIVRVVYEALIMFIMIWRNTKDIADNTKKK